MKNSSQQTKPSWIAWGITLGEASLLLAFGVVLSQYWLMLPVWLRTCAGSGLGLAFLIVGYRFFKFRKSQKRQPQPTQSAPAEVSVV